MFTNTTNTTSSKLVFGGILAFIECCKTYKKERMEAVGMSLIEARYSGAALSCLGL
jgi:hypothetical protein